MKFVKVAVGSEKLQAQLSQSTVKVSDGPTTNRAVPLTDTSQ